MRHETPAMTPPASATGSRVMALAHGWSSLGDQATLPTQHPDFMQAASAAFLPHAPHHLVEAVGEEGVIGVAALVRDAGPFARWRLVGDREVHEPGAPLYADAGALAGELCELGRAVEFTRVPATSALVDAFEAAARGRGFFLKRRAVPGPYLELDESWREPESHFNSRRRSDFRRAQRRAEEFGTVDYAMHRPSPEVVDALLDEALEVEAAGWKRAAGTAILCDPAKERFFREYLRGCCARGETRIATLRIDGALVAMHLAVAWRGRYWLYKIGFDDEFAKCSPGTLLMLFALGEAAREGLTGFEMMGEADGWIADLWTREAHEYLRLRFYPRTLAGFAALAEDGFAWVRERLARRFARGKEPR